VDKKTTRTKRIPSREPSYACAIQPRIQMHGKKYLNDSLSTEETTLIGHSCGAGFIVRYLSENNIHVGKVVLVAPWIDPDKILETGMFDFTPDENLVSKTKGVTIFNSDDDMEEVQKSVKILTEKIKNIEVREFQNMGHFCFEDMGTEEFPKLLEEVLK
jgi:predicted alpha/beta hydrolase family esterase